MSKNQTIKIVRGTGNLTVPAGVSYLKVTPQRISGVGTIAASFASFGRTFDGRVFAWGGNANGDLGDGTVVSKSSPIAVVTSRLFSEVSIGTATHFRTSDGAVFSCGDNTYGQLGDGTTVKKSTPVAVVGNHSFVQVVARAASFGLKGDGSLFAWGYNGGNFGDGTTTNRSSPVAVAGANVFSKVAAGGDGGPVGFTIGMKPDGTLMSWGRNSDGQLGQGTSGFTPVLTPAPVLGGHKFVDIAAGNNHVLALKENGDLYAWGSNSYGELGNGSNVSVSSPILIPGMKFRKIEACSDGAANGMSIGIDFNGKAFAWGSNSIGNLGDGTIIDRNVPTAVSGGNTFAEIACDGGTVIARRTDGSLLAWGGNALGQLGDGTIVNKSTPVAVLGSNAFKPVPRDLSVGFFVEPGAVVPFSTGPTGLFSGEIIGQDVETFLIEYFS